MVVLKAVIDEKFGESFSELQRCWIVRIVSFLANIAKTFFKLNVIMNWFSYTYVSVHTVYKTVCFWPTIIKVIKQVAWKQKTCYLQVYFIAPEEIFSVKIWLPTICQWRDQICLSYSLCMERPTSINSKCFSNACPLC